MKKQIQSKAAALEKTAELWEWLAKNPDKKKKQWPGWRDHTAINHCFLCDYVVNYEHFKTACEEVCPLKTLWPLGCAHRSSPFTIWAYATTPDLADARSQQAAVIADEARFQLSTLSGGVE